MKTEMGKHPNGNLLIKVSHANFVIVAEIDPSITPQKLHGIVRKLRRKVRRRMV